MAAGNGGQKMSQYSWFTVYFPCGEMAMYKNGHEKSRRIFVH